MEKLVWLNAVEPVTPPADALFRKNKAYITLDLKAVFHEGYLDQFGVHPETDEQPLQFYQRFITATEDLRFEPQILGVGDYSSGGSHMLGRYFGRGYLSTHQGYTWFAHVKEAMKFPVEDTYAYGVWKVERPNKGTLMPDRLIARPNQVAVAEAKGTIKPISPQKKQAWRQQAQNLHLYNGSELTSIKGWVVATRIATVDTPKVPTELYVEDPDTPGEPINADQLPSLVSWVARLHTARNLLRLGQTALAIRLLHGSFQKDQPPILVPVYRCMIPGLEERLFIGMPHINVACNLAIQFLLSALMNSQRLSEIVRLQADTALSQGFFDGVDLSTVTHLRSGEVTPLDNRLLHRVNRYLGISLRPDGSLLCGLDVIEPVTTIEIY